MKFRLLKVSILTALSVAATLSMLTAQRATAKDETPEPSRELGKELFKRDWSKHEPERGDGLGPMFNAVSCVECHEMGGVGGAGKPKHNVDLLSLVAPRPKGKVASPQLLKRLREIHPDLNATQLSVTLHKSGYQRRGDELEKSPAYDLFRQRFATGGPESSPGSPGINNRVKREHLVFEISQRSTPALFGAGLIDQVPDKVLIELAKHQKDNVPGISGRVPQTPTGAVGRFGWRGQIGSLHDFVLGACVNELGLQVAQHQPEPENPTDIRQWAKHIDFTPNDFSKKIPPTARKPDLTEHECLSLTAFIGSLPAPVQLNGTSLTQSKAALRGQELFNQIGCSDCHVENLGPAGGIYSDLLLHDMGSALADAVSAVPELDEHAVPFSGGYSGGFVPEQLVKITTKINQEWRTPPLWGVRDSSPYLHDGRAVSLDDAIRMHGGEAAASARRYRSLGTLDRDRVVAFLSTLAPKGARPRAVFFPNQNQGGGAFGFGGSGGGPGFFSIDSSRARSGLQILVHDPNVSATH